MRRPRRGYLRFLWHLTCGGAAVKVWRPTAKRSTQMMILGEWLGGKMEEAGQAFAAGRPAALAMVLGEMKGALVARDGNFPEVFTAIDRLGEAEKAAMRGQIAAARESYDAAAECIRELIRLGAARSETAVP